MLVTIVQNSDEYALVHRAGCTDIKRREMRQRAYLSQWDADVATQQEAANDAWSDFIAEDMTEEAALGYTTFLPCCAELPAAAITVPWDQAQTNIAALALHRMAFSAPDSEVSAEMRETARAAHQTLRTVLDATRPGAGAS
jgi:hypothetical protein